MSDLKYKIEALLFVSGDALGIKKIKHLLQNISEDEIKKALDDLATDYKQRGVRILYKDDLVQMVSAPQYASLIAQFVKSHLTQELSQSALETLACIAYNEPMSKIEIDELRGVNSIFAIRSLLIRGLIIKVNNKGKSVKDVESYTVSLDFLKKIGIEKVNDLPHYEQTQGN